jgi:hypothetical protein
MAELVDALASGASVPCGRGSSSLLQGTKTTKSFIILMYLECFILLVYINANKTLKCIDIFYASILQNTISPDTAGHLVAILHCLLADHIAVACKKLPNGSNSPEAVIR